MATIYRWDEIPLEQLNPHLSRKVLHGDQVTIAKLWLKQGAVVPRHSHHNEQVTNVDTGRLKFVFDDGEMLVGPGESLQIPAHAPHLVEALEDTHCTDLFVPVREDWRTGADAYLRR